MTKEPTTTDLTPRQLSSASIEAAAWGATPLQTVVVAEVAVAVAAVTKGRDR